MSRLPKPERLSEVDKARLLQAVQTAAEHDEQFGDLHLKLRKHFLLEDAREEPCRALIFHGPGHQSKTRCRLRGHHVVHEAVYGSMSQLARWRGDETSSGAFDEPPRSPEG